MANESPDPLPPPDAGPHWALRLALCFATGSVIAITAFICAFLEFGSRFEHATLRGFLLSPETEGIKLTCALAGLAAFPLFFLYSRTPRSAGSITLILAANAVTVLVTVVIAVAIAVLHLPSGH